MMKVDCDCILLDIEGTTSSVSYVYDEMFPFVRNELSEFLAANWGTESLNESIQLIAADAELENWPDTSLTEAEQVQQVAAEVLRQMDNDMKVTGLKNLQGKIWKSGFESGALQAHVYEDVLPALDGWKAANKDIRIYSSGSVQAQLLFFGHTIVGNLLDRFSAHYDTKVGGKKESPSYMHIAGEAGLDPARILFVSDIVAELDAAREAGLQTALSLRPGNAEVASDNSHPAISSFAEIELA